MRPILFLRPFTILSLVATLSADPAALMGSGSFYAEDVASASSTTDVCAQKIRALQAQGMKIARVGLYPYGYWDVDSTNAPTPVKYQALVTRLRNAGITPMFVFEYYTWMGANDTRLQQATWLTYSRFWNLGKAFADTYQSQGVQIYAAMNEPDLRHDIDLNLYGTAMAGLADGVHASNASLRVINGGFMAANAWNNYTCVGYALRLKDLYNQGRLNGLCLHTYYGKWASLDQTRDNSAQLDFDRVKSASGITVDLDFYADEFNVNTKAPDSGGNFFAVNDGANEDIGAKFLFTGVFDQLAVCKNNGTSATRLALLWSSIDAANVESTTYMDYRVFNQIDPWWPRSRGAQMQRIASWTAGMEWTSLAGQKDGSGLLIMAGNGAKGWVWHNRTNWTSVPGSSYTISGIPAGHRTLTVNNWTGQLQSIAIANRTAITVTGLPTQETILFVSR